MQGVRQREPRIILNKWTRAAKGEACTIRHPEHCNGNPETTVAAHSNWDKGVGMKCDDTMIVFACSACHDWMDKTRDEERLRMWLRGHARTLRRLYEMGLITQEK